MTSFLRKFVIPVSFAVAALSFFLDFVTYKTPHHITSLTGFDLLQIEKEKHAYWMYIVLFLSLTGIIGSLLKGRITNGIGFLLALAGIIFLLVGQFALIENFTNKSYGAISILFELGYWLCLIALALAGSRSYLLQYRVTQKEEGADTRGAVNINIITQTSSRKDK
jgi:hypothetical protein